MKKKNELRMGVIFSIAMFLLMPLISSPVAAVVNFNAGTGTTTNPAVGPITAIITMSAPFTTPPGATTPLVVSFTYNFVDTNGGGTGSDHICTMTVTQTSPPGGSVMASTGWTFIAKNSGTTTGTLTTTSDFTTTQGVTILFTIEVYMKVIDISTSAWDDDTDSTTITVIT